MLDELTSLEFAEWSAYFQVEPFGNVLQDVHFATLESLFANANRAKGQAPMQPKKFRLSQPSEKANAQDLWSRLKSWALLEKGNKDTE